MAVVVRDGHVLLAKRSPDRSSYPGVWDAIGGHLEPGEDAIAAIHRELHEELGISECVVEFLGNVSDEEDAIDYSVFVVMDWAGTLENRTPNEHSEIRWFAVRETPEHPVPPTRGYLGMVKAFLARV